MDIRSPESGPPSCSRVVLARHGETDSNQRRIILGHGSDPLTEDGRAQARQLGRAIAKYPLTAAYCSDLPRAIETATLALEGRDIKPQPVEGLRELNWGALEGLSVYLLEDETPADHGRVPRVGRGQQIPHPVAPPGGETLLEGLERFVGAVEGIAARHCGESVLIVTHNMLMRAWLSQILRWPLDRCWDIMITFCAHCVLDVSPGQACIADLGSIRFDARARGWPP